MFSKQFGSFVTKCGRLSVAVMATSKSGENTVPVNSEINVAKEVNDVIPSQNLDDKIAVIGGGWCGLTALKELKAYGFKNVRMLEASTDIGGQWDLKNEMAQTWSKVRCNISKMNMHYPDFPYPIDPKEPLHATIDELHEYLHRYAKAFDLFPNIQFRSKVHAIEPTDPKNKTSSKWKVRYTYSGDGQPKEVVETFDRVVVCTGRFGRPRIPPLAGNFAGEIKMLTDIKNMNFEGKKMIVVGNSISAIDVMELSCLSGAKHITCVYRTPRYYVPMWLPDGTPFEQTSRKYADSSLIRKRLDKGGLQLSRYGFVKPNDAEVASGKMKTGISLCRSFEYWVKTGKIRGCHGTITNCEGKKVTLSDGSVIEDVDTILFTTGFEPDIPILPRDIFQQIYRPEVKERRFLLYLLTFVPGWYNQSLAFIGIQPIVESNPTMFELQSRMIGHFWSGAKTLLPQSTEETQQKWIYTHLIKNDYTPLLPDIAKQSYHIADDIAQFIGCKPQNAEIVNLLEEAGFIPEQYRIEGPHKNEQALALLKWKLDNRFKDSPANMIKHMRLTGKVSPVKLYGRKCLYNIIRPLLDKEEKKARLLNKEKEIKTIQIEENVQ
jgi:dimethylaniline monooxygenase (N-oxide forming)